MSDMVRYAGVEAFVLIGSSDLMIYTAELLRARDQRLIFVIAPRYANRPSVLGDETLEQAGKRLDAKVHHVNDINNFDTRAKLDDGLQKLALCFGAAWIFNGETRALFEFGMLNFNAIPQPRYLGGAHVTWQILNGDRTGGCVMQEIGPKVDHGDLIRVETYSFPESARTPRDYLEHKYRVGCDFIARFLDDLLAGAEFRRTPYDTVNHERLYFPRLLTAEHAYIDWRWPAPQIESFCRAFDTPFAGAMTWCRGERLRLLDVVMSSDEGISHPFCSGLVVRRTDEALFVSAGGGLLRVGSVVCDDGTNRLDGIREGQRLYTPSEALERAMRTSIEVQSDGGLMPVLT